MKSPGTPESAQSWGGGQGQAGKSAGGALPDALVEGTRTAMSPPGDARHDLIDAAISRLEPRKQKLDRPPAPWEVALAGFLVGLAMFAFLVGRMTEAEAAPVLLRAVASVAGGGVAAAYLWNRGRPR